MANRVLNMIFKADTSQAQTEMKKLKGDTGGEGIAGVIGSLQDFIAPAAAVAGAVGAAGAAIKQTLDDWRDYALSVGELRDSLNITTQEASVLMGIMEQYNITAETMTSVFRRMATEGITPTAASLQGLLVEYSNINDATEKMNFANKMLGEQGMRQLLPMWDSLTQAQRENFSVQQIGLDTTAEGIRLAREQEEALKNLARQSAEVGQAFSLWFARGANNAADFINALLGIETATEDLTGDTKTYVDFLKQEHAGLLKIEELTDEVKESKTWLDVATRIQTEGLNLETLAAWENVAALQAQLAAIRELAGNLEAMSPMLGMGYDPYEGNDPYAGSPDHSGAWQTDAMGRKYKRDAQGYFIKGPGYATGGTFKVGGSGGSDSTPVSFMATPGETVSVGGGTNDMAQILSEVRRLVDTLPVTIADAMERR